MRNVLDKSCRESEDTHSMFNNCFPKIVPFMTCRENLVETGVPQMTSQYGVYALLTGLAMLYARMRMHMPTRSYTHMHTRTHARGVMHTQFQM
jgi:hypothetical protein